MGGSSTKWIFLGLSTHGPDGNCRQVGIRWLYLILVYILFGYIPYFSLCFFCVYLILVYTLFWYMLYFGACIILVYTLVRCIPYFGVHIILVNTLLVYTLSGVLRIYYLGISYLGIYMPYFGVFLSLVYTTFGYTYLFDIYIYTLCLAHTLFWYVVAYTFFFWNVFFVPR